MTVYCQHCDTEAELVRGLKIYPHRPDLSGKKFWECPACGAYSGCHPGTIKPLGAPSNAILRRAKVSAHAAFDPLWKTGKMKRGDAYGYLADKLGIPKSECHIGWMNLEMARRVVQVLQTAQTVPSKATPEASAKPLP